MTKEAELLLRSEILHSAVRDSLFLEPTYVCGCFRGFPGGSPVNTGAIQVRGQQQGAKKASSIQLSKNATSAVALRVSGGFARSAGFKNPLKLGKYYTSRSEVVSRTK